MTKKLQFHGSDIEKVASYYHLSKDQIINFGANVNPLRISKQVLTDLSENLSMIGSYPDPDYRSLKQAISEYCDCSTSQILVGNGATELISLLVRLLRPKKALILGPTYSEYERELSLIGCDLSHFFLTSKNEFTLDCEALIKELTDELGLLILCNPNNPTSTVISQEELFLILDHCKKKDIFVMIDETYMEFVDNMEHCTAIPLTTQFTNLLVLRGVSKFFAAPGLRFGYGITSNKHYLDTVKKEQNPWTLNSVGAYAGERMLKDTSYIAQTKALIHGERERIYSALKCCDFLKPFWPHANFILVQLLKPGLTASRVFEDAIKEGLMLRDCSSFEALHGEFVRFCFMLPEDNDRVIALWDRYR